jgi:hypothetical protein
MQDLDESYVISIQDLMTTCDPNARSQWELFQQRVQLFVCETGAWSNGKDHFAYLETIDFTNRYPGVYEIQMLHTTSDIISGFWQCF